MVPSANRLKAMLRQVVASFDAAGVAHALAGGLAMAVHGLPRATKDLDFLIAGADAGKAGQALAGLGFAPASDARGFVRYVRSPVPDLPELQEWTDILLASRAIGLRLIDEAQAQRLDWEAMSLAVVSVEGLILMKLLAYSEDPRRAIDLADIAALLAARRGDLDTASIRTGAAELGDDVLALFDKLERQSVRERETDYHVPKPGRSV